MSSAGKAVLVGLALLATPGAAIAQQKPPPNVMGDITNNYGVIIQGNEGTIIVQYQPARLRVLGERPVEKVGENHYIRRLVVEIIGTSPPNALLAAVAKEDVIPPTNRHQPSIMIARPGKIEAQWGQTDKAYYDMAMVPPAGGYDIVYRVKTPDGPLRTDVLLK